jgi:hypothetical protein
MLDHGAGRQGERLDRLKALEERLRARPYEPSDEEVKREVAELGKMPRLFRSPPRHVSS